MDSLIPSPLAIVNLIREIRNAAKLAGENEEEREEIMSRVAVVRDAMEDLRRASPAVLQKERTKLALSRTEAVLEDALKAVRKQGRASTAYRRWSARDNARYLDSLKEKITFWGNEIHRATMTNNDRDNHSSRRRQQHPGQQRSQHAQQRKIMPSAASSTASHVKRPAADITSATIPGAAAAGYSAVTQTTPSALSAVLKLDKKGRREELMGSFKEFRLCELQDATKNFSTVKHIGGGVDIFKGVLADGSQVAVRKFGPSNCLSYREFVSEITHLAIFDHANIVKCIGFNLVQETILVYEEMPEQTLDTFIRQNSERIGEESHLDLSSRFRIIKGIAEGVAFVHSNMLKGSPLLQGCLHPCSILLDSHGNPKISNIGISNILEKSAIASTSSGISSSVSKYRAPELIYGRKTSKESDVHTFGVIALETMTGISMTQEDKPAIKPLSKVQQWQELLKCKATKVQTLSQHLGPTQRCIRAAMACVDEDPEKRPAMIKVLDIINGKR